MSDEREPNAFERYLGRHELPGYFSQRAATIGVLAEFVMLEENNSAGFVIWRMAARLCAGMSDHLWKNAFTMVIQDVDAYELLYRAEDPLNLFMRVTLYMNEFLLSG